MNWYYLLIVAHIIGTALGVGAVTVGDSLFFRALKNKRIDTSMVETWQTISGIVWTGLSILFFSGVLFFVVYRLGTPTHLSLAFTSKFWLKMLIVGVLFLNGIIMHWKSMPLLARVAAEGGKLSSPRFLSSAGLFFATSAISFVSWYTALMLGIARNFPLTFFQGLGIYLAVLILAILVSQIIRVRVQRYLLQP